MLMATFTSKFCKKRHIKWSEQGKQKMFNVHCTGEHKLVLTFDNWKCSFLKQLLSTKWQFRDKEKKEISQAVTM